MNSEVVELYLDDIIPNRSQPREIFNEESLKELSASIKEHGVIQPIIVRKIGDKYEIIAGERRYKASALAGLTKIPAIIRNLDDKEASKVALLENLQRKDLTAIEEARTYQKILELDTMTQEELGRSMGKSQAAIANKMRLLSLPDEVQEALLKDQISERHARSLLNLTNPIDQVTMLKKVISNRMTVKELDNEIKSMKEENLSANVTNPATVSEAESKVEVEEVTSDKVEPKEEKDTFDDTDFSLIPDIKFDIEELDEIDDDDDDTSTTSAPIKEEKIEVKENNPEDDLKTIDELLKKTTVYTVKDAVNEIKSVVAKLQNKGIDIKIEEMDFENTYQVVLKIEKDK